MRGLAAVVVSVGLLAGGLLASSAASSEATPTAFGSLSSPAAGGFGAVTPARILDTRATAAVPAGGTITVQVTGANGVPASGVSAVAVNLIALSATRAGYLTAYADGTARPHAAVLNFAAGQTIDNEVIVPVGANGKIALYNGAPGTVQIIADLAGYYTGGTPATGGFGAVTPARILDTRGTAAVPAGGTITVQVTGAAGVPAGGVSAVAVNLIALSGSRAGYLTAYADGTARPHAAVLNFAAGQTIDNEVIVPVGANGKIALYNGAPGTVQIIADLAGYYTGGTPATGGFGALTPARILDTRATAAVPAGGTITVQVTGANGIPASGVSAVAVNLIALSATRAGYLTAYADGTSRPHAAVLNFAADQTIDNEVIVPVGANGKIALYNGAPGTVQIIADLAGYYTGGTVDGTPPGPVTGVQATPANSSVALSWVNPTDADFAGVVIRRAAGSTPPASPTAGVAVAATAAAATSFTDTGLSVGTTYSYALFAHDAVPNYAAGTTRTVTTTTPPGTGCTFLSGGFHYCHAGVYQYVTADGVHMSTPVQSPVVAADDYHSVTELAVESADGQQIIEIGWRVFRPQDQTPRLFIFHWVDGQPICFNSGCGFVQSGSTTITPGMALTPSSTPVQFAIKYSQGNWWYGYNGTWFGYLPGSIWDGTFTQTGLVQMYGEVASTTVWPCTDMGNGKLGTDASAAAVTGIGYYNTTTAVSLALSTAEDPAIYDGQLTSATSFRYGGPGAC